MFIDASALCAVVALEEDSAHFAERMSASTRSITSATALWEATVAVARIRSIAPAVAEAAVRSLLHLMQVELVPIPPEAGGLAVRAFERFGKGRHPAALNFGDCFAYACARHYRVPLLYKGADFALTDIEPA